MNTKKKTIQWIAIRTLILSKSKQKELIEGAVKRPHNHYLQHASEHKYNNTLNASDCISELCQKAQKPTQRMTHHLKIRFNQVVMGNL